MFIHFAIILILAIIYGYLNGIHSSASVVSTIIASRAIHPRFALILAACSISLGPFLLGTAVADTISEDFISPDAITTRVIAAAILGAILWSSTTLWLKIPSSISQSLFGGLIGASWAGFGLGAIQTSGLYKILIALFISPILGLFIALWLVKLIYFLTQWADPHINRWFNRGQILASVLMGITFGANNGQIIVAAIMLGLIANSTKTSYIIPEWVVIVSALTVGLGTLTGGMRLIHTLGGKFYKIRPIHGFGAQLASVIVIFSAATLGGPVSASQVVISSILGAGSADRIQKVRWSVAQHIMMGWLLTLPFSALFAIIVYQITERIFL